MPNAQTATPSPDAPAAEELSTPNPAAEQLMQLQVLSQAPLSLEEALEQEAAVAEEIDATPPTATGLLLRGAAHLALFVGVGLVAASVVHYGDDPTLYGLLALGGAALFAGGSVASARKAARRGIVAALMYGATSLALGLGVGLLLGGLLNYSAAPHQSTVTIPLGLVLAIAAFFARDGRALIGKEMLPTAVALGGLLVWLSIGLGFGAKQLDPPPAAAGPAAEHGAPAADGHGAAATDEHGGSEAAAGDGHGEAAAADGHGEAAASDGHGEAAAADGHGAEKADGHGAEKAAAGHDAEKAAAAEGHGEAAAAAPKADAHGAAADEHKAAADEAHAAPAAEEHAAGH